MKILGFEIKLPRFLSWERRGGERVYIYEALYVNYRALNGKLSGSGSGRDISASGIRFHSDKKIPKGTPLELTLRFTPGALPHNIQTLPVHSSVISCSKKFKQTHYDVACAFEDMGEEASRIIQLFISWLKEREQKYLFFRYQSKEDQK